MTRIHIDPTPRHPLSPRLYMQFMEPLGTTDSSVEAGWDFERHAWRPSLLEAVRDLAPGAIRWGGILTSYWKWREGVGPRDRRTPMINHLWGGQESNQVGVHEILELCRLVDADPILAVNFAADGRPEYLRTATGEDRSGTPEEAADLVSYCNEPEHPERRRNGAAEPWDVRLWQLGNETSYPPAGQRFSSRENAETFRAFARAMRERDPSIELIGWGDQEEKTGAWWAEDLLDAAGDDVDYVAAHMMRQIPEEPDTLLRGTRYQRDYDGAWRELLGIHCTVERKLLELRELLASRGSDAKIAITEGHLSLRPHNRNPILLEWIAGLYHAKVMNLYERHSDVVEISTLADFFGNSWHVNAVMLPSPNARPYLLPAGSIQRLYRRHSGDRALAVACASTDLDVTASRRGDRVFVHVLNANLHDPQKADIALDGACVSGGRTLTIAPNALSSRVDQDDADALLPVEHPVAGGETLELRFPPASVTAVELELAALPT